MNIFSDILDIKDAPNECDVVRSAAPIRYANQFNIQFSYYNYLY